MPLKVFSCFSFVTYLLQHPSLSNLYIHFLLYPFSFNFSSISFLQAKCTVLLHFTFFIVYLPFLTLSQLAPYPSGLGCRNINLFRLCRDLRSDPISQLSYSTCTMSYSYVYWQIKCPVQIQPVLCTYEHTLLGEYKYNTAVFIPIICWYLIYREIENLKRLRHEMNIF